MQLQYMLNKSRIENEWTEMLRNIYNFSIQHILLSLKFIINIKILHGQWWSNLETQRLQIEQCLDLAGLIRQYKIIILLE